MPTVLNSKWIRDELAEYIKLEHKSTEIKKRKPFDSSKKDVYFCFELRQNVSKFFVSPFSYRMKMSLKRRQKPSSRIDLLNLGKCVLTIGTLKAANTTMANAWMLLSSFF